MNGIVRFDYIQDEEKIYLNEINTIPGAIANYLYKDQLSFKLLLDEQIRETLFKFEEENRLLNNYKSTILDNTKLVFKK